MVKGELVGTGRRVKVGAKFVPATSLQRIKQLFCLAAGHINGNRVVLGEHPVTGGEGGEIELLGSGCSYIVEKLIEHLGHEVPRRACVKQVPVGFPHPTSPAQVAIFLI